MSKINSVRQRRMTQQSCYLVRRRRQLYAVILLNMQSNSREATVRRADAAKPLVINIPIHSCGMLVSHSTNIFSHLKGNLSIVLMHSGIVNAYQLLCDAHSVPVQHKGTTDIFLYYSLYTFPAFILLYVCQSVTAFLFWVPQ